MAEQALVTLDPAVLADLLDAVGTEAFLEIAAAFRDTLRHFAVEGPAADAHTVGGMCHALKGAASYLGAAEVLRWAVEGDRLHKAGGDARTVVGAILAAIPATLTAVEDHCGRLPRS